MPRPAQSSTHPSKTVATLDVDFDFLSNLVNVKEIDSDGGALEDDNDAGNTPKQQNSRAMITITTGMVVGWLGHLGTHVCIGTCYDVDWDERLLEVVSLASNAAYRYLRRIPRDT